MYRRESIHVLKVFTQLQIKCTSGVRVVCLQSLHMKKTVHIEYMYIHLQFVTMSLYK